jgi:HK97 family phage portal protein
MASRFRDHFLRVVEAVRPVGRGERFPGISEYLHDQPWAMPENVLDFPKATALIPTIYAVTSRIANDLAAVPPTFYRGTGESRKKIEREPGNIVDVWTKANPVQTGYELEQDRQLSLDVNGNGYMYLERFGRNAAPEELWMLPGHLVRPAPGPRRSIEYYEFGYASRMLKLPPESVIHFRYTNPSWDPLEPAPVGLSPLSAAAKDYEIRFNMLEWQNVVVRKGGNVSYIFSVDKDVAVKEPKLQQWQESIKRRMQGLKNAGDPFIMQGMKIERTGFTLDEMKFLETFATTDEDICAVYGTSTFILGKDKGSGLREGATEGMQLQHVEGCILPRIRLRDAVLTEKFCPLYEKGIVCETDVSGILAIQNARLKQAETIVTLVGKVMTPNEARQRLDLPKFEAPEADELTFAPDPLELEEAKAKIAGGDGGSKPKKPGEKSPGGRSANRRTAFADDARAARADADLKRYEKKVAAGMREVFTVQEGIALEALRRMARAQGMEMSRTARLDLDAEIIDMPFDDDAKARLSALFAELVRERGEAAAAEIAREITLDMTAERIARFLREKIELLVTGTTETTKKLLQAELAQAAANQENFGQIAERVREVFEHRRANALTIARTETAQAYNFAAFEAWTASGESLEKEWVTVGDELVRDAHAALNGRRIPMDSYFEVEHGGALARALYPLGFGVADLDINCRCVCVAHVMEPAGMGRYFPSRNGHVRLGGRLAGLFAEVR